MHPFEADGWLRLDLQQDMVHPSPARATASHRFLTVTFGDSVVFSHKQTEQGVHALQPGPLNGRRRQEADLQARHIQVTCAITGRVRIGQHRSSDVI